MSTSVDDKRKLKPYLEEYPFLALQKLIGFGIGLLVIVVLYNITRGDLHLVSEVMMYPDVNFGLYAFSVLLIGYVVFIILQESWLMKTEIGLEIHEDKFILYCFDWNTHDVEFNQVKQILVSKFSSDSENGWFKVELHTGKTFSVFINNVDQLIKDLPKSLKPTVQQDEKTLTLVFAGTFLLVSSIIALAQFGDFYFFELAFYGVVLAVIYALVLFKKSLSSKKILRREFEVGVLFIIPALMMNFVSQLPLSEIDRLFYGQMQMIQAPIHVASLEEKIELCDHIRDNYTNLKPTMLQELERVCSVQILNDSVSSKANLDRAFNWAYSQYVKKQEAHQVISLACLYAETDQKDFAVALARKHSMSDLARDFSKGVRCRPNQAQSRGLASTR